MKTFIQQMIENRHLTREDAACAMREIMEGRATNSQIAAFLIALTIKGEQKQELLGFIEVMKEKSINIQIEDPDAIDMCGTGGDRSGTFNISTVASFVVAGAGVTVAKHGNRSVSSLCGSADVLQSLGINIEVGAETMAACINTVGIGFLFAPMFHPAMKFAAPARKEIGIKTCFNLLGPMMNPAGVRRQLVGTYNRVAAQLMADVFLDLITKKVFVINAHDGLDEISLSVPTSVYEVNGNRTLQHYDIAPSEFHLPITSPLEIQGGTKEQNASLAVDILKGENIPHRIYVIANAAVGLMVAGKAATIDDGVHLATEAIDSGRALNKLIDLISYTQR